jgi:tetratricopeptide (TPR) repeat protein
VFVQRFPNNPALRSPARIAAVRGDYDRAEAIAKEIESKIANSRTGMIQQRGFMSNIALTRGRLESLPASHRAARTSGAGRNAALAKLRSAWIRWTTAIVLENKAEARAQLERALKRAPIDSIPYLDRDYGNFLMIAAMAGDTARAREWHSESRKSWEAAGKLIDRPAWLSVDDASLAFARGDYAGAVENARRADQMNFQRTDIIAVMRFLSFDRAQQVDSAIAAGEAYLANTHDLRMFQDANFLAGIRQRLGEMYEGNGNVDKALTHYQAFVDLWKDADPELQPRVRDVGAWKISVARNGG